RLRAFYWGIEEKLLVYDYIPHGSLANAYYGGFSCSLETIQNGFPHFMPYGVFFATSGANASLCNLYVKKRVLAFYQKVR
ncbi:hypothetical protein NQ272_27645, partial [Escherichia coli]|nr:hypothetical protein [Escherichia coli]